MLFGVVRFGWESGNQPFYVDTFSLPAPVYRLPAVCQRRLGGRRSGVTLTAITAHFIDFVMGAIRMKDPR